MSRAFLRNTLLQGCRDELEAHRDRAASGRKGCADSRRKMRAYSAGVLEMEMEVVSAADNQTDGKAAA